jgi:MFS family permease
MSERSSVRKVVAASLVGTSLEWYDFFLYGSAAALVFNRLFFPTFDPLTGTLLAFTTFAVGFVARPIGGIIFGHFGDKVGRKNVLVITLLLMGVATFLVGLLPTYDAIGVAAPLLLVTLRFVQGLGLGGEWGGAVLMALEHGNDERRGLHAAWPQVAVPAGNLLAAAVLGLLAWLLPEAAFESWGWRIPFLLSAVLIVVGLWIRLAIAESPLFADVERTHTRARAPILDVLRVYPREVLVAIGARLGVDVAFYTFALFILTYATTQAGVPRSVALAAVLTGSAVQLVLIPWFGRTGSAGARSTSPVPLARWCGCGCSSRCSTPGGPGWCCSPRSAGSPCTRRCTARRPRSSRSWCTRLRYSGASLGYQLAGVLGGGLAPIISVALLGRFHAWHAVAVYVVAALLVTLAALAAARETAHAPLTAEKPAERAILEHPEVYPSDVVGTGGRPQRRPG